MRCCVLVCLPALPCLVCPPASLFACLLAGVRAWVDPAYLGTGNRPGQRVDRSRGGLLAGTAYLEDCDMRRTPTRLCNYRPVPLGLLARAAGEQEADLA